MLLHCLYIYIEGRYPSQSIDHRGLVYCYTTYIYIYIYIYRREINPPGPLITEALHTITLLINILWSEIKPPPVSKLIILQIWFSDFQVYLLTLLIDPPNHNYHCEAKAGNGIQLHIYLLSTASYISIVTLCSVSFGVEQLDRSVMHFFLWQISVNFCMILSCCCYCCCVLHHNIYMLLLLLCIFIGLLFVFLETKELSLLNNI